MSSMEDLMRRMEALEIANKENKKRISDLEGANSVLSGRILKALKTAEQRGLIPAR